MQKIIPSQEEFEVHQTGMEIGALQMCVYLRLVALCYADYLNPRSSF